MSFAQIKDNDALIGKIRTMITSGSVPHAFIIESPRSIDKTAFATAFAQALLCPEAPGEGCGECPTCRKGYPNVCDKVRCYGVQMDGGFQDYIVVDEKHLSRF